jgi:polo-like kinase 4
MYEGTFVCTLMANEPRADIEIRTNPRSITAAASASATSTIRIRFSRKLRTMQIFISEPALCKKTMFCTARGVPTDAGDWALLSKNEKECLAALLDFLRVAESVEGLPRNASTERLPKLSPKREETPHAIPSAAYPPQKSDVYPPGTDLPRLATTPTAIPLPSASGSATAPPPSSGLTPMTVSPRPRFPSAALRRATSDTFRKASGSSRTAVSDVPAPAPPAGDPSLSPLALATRAEDDEAGSWRDLTMTTGGGGSGSGSGGSSPRLQTRFMPGVGWCVRSGGARYRIMFADGVALEVDVGEERVELVERDGSVLRFEFFLLFFFLSFLSFVCFGTDVSDCCYRCTVRECGASRKIGDRMKVFHEFLLLFEESDP